MLAINVSRLLTTQFKITNVTLGPKCHKGEKVTLMLQHRNDDACALYTLESGSINQYQMNLSFKIGEEITFYLDSDKLSDKVHLTGIYLGEGIPSGFDFDEPMKMMMIMKLIISMMKRNILIWKMRRIMKRWVTFMGTKAVRMSEVEEFTTSDSDEELSAEEMLQEQRKPQASSSKKPEQQKATTIL